MNAPLNYPFRCSSSTCSAFVAIAETGSFTTAATPSSVRPRRFPCRSRSSRTFWAFRLLARRAFGLADDRRRNPARLRQANARGQPRGGVEVDRPDIVGLVRIGSPDDYGERGLPHAPKRFAQSHPSIAVDVHRRAINLRRRMSEQTLDIALVTNSFKARCPEPKSC